MKREVFVNIDVVFLDVINTPDVAATCCSEMNEKMCRVMVERWCFGWI